MDWLAGASRWVIDSNREGLQMACPVQCRERAQDRIKRRREQIRTAIRRNKKRLVH